MQKKKLGNESPRKPCEAQDLRRMIQFFPQALPAGAADRLASAVKALRQCKGRQRLEDRLFAPRKWVRFCESEAEFQRATQELVALGKEFPQAREIFIKILRELPGHVPTTRYVVEGVIESLQFLGRLLGELFVPAVEGVTSHLAIYDCPASRTLRQLIFYEPKLVVDALYRHLTNYPWCWQIAAWLLRQLHPGRVLYGAPWIESELRGVRAAGLVHLAMVNPCNKAVTRLIKAALRDSDAIVRCGAVEAAFCLPDSPSARRLLLQALQDRDAMVLNNWAQNMSQNDRWCKALLPHLKRVLRDHPCKSVRRGVAEGLWLVGVKALPALLNAAKDDRDKQVRSAAQWAITMITDREAPRK